MSLGPLLVVSAAVLWSTSGLFIRWTVAGSGFSALSLAFGRDLTTALCLLGGLALFRPAWLRVERQHLPWLAALGVVGIGTFHVLWNLSMLHLGYPVATVMLCSSPAFVSVMARLLYGEPLTRTKIVAILLALTGCVLVAGKEELAGVEWTAGALILGLGTALAYGGFSLFGRKVARRYSPWTVLTYGFSFGALVLFPIQFFIAPPWPVPPQNWLWFGGLVLPATIVPFALYVAGLRRLPASVASILVTSEVAFGALVGYLFFGEQLREWQIAGAGLVIAGVILIAVTTRENQAPAS